LKPEIRILALSIAACLNKQNLAQEIETPLYPHNSASLRHCGLNKQNLAQEIETQHCGLLSLLPPCLNKQNLAQEIETSSCSAGLSGRDWLEQTESRPRD